MDLPNPRSTNIIIVIITILVMILILNLYHIYGFMNTCSNCETPYNWGHCSGFETIRNNIEKNNLFNFLTFIEDFSINLKKKKATKKLNNQ